MSRVNFIKLVDENTKKAKEKHPNFASSLDHIICLAMEELGEAGNEILKGDTSKFKAEMVDLASVAKRAVDGDKVSQSYTSLDYQHQQARKFICLLGKAVQALNDGDVSTYESGLIALVDDVRAFLYGEIR